MKRSKISNRLLPIAAIGMMLALLIWSAAFAQGIRDGISICLNNLIPSLFLFMILCSFFMESGIGKRMLSVLISPIAKLFHISKSGAAIFCFSLLGGFPIGAKLLSDAVKRNEMNPDTAERMLAYCVNCGPAFLISAVSIPVFHNYTVGIIVYCSQILAAVIIGILSGRKIKERTASAPSNKTNAEPASPAYSACFIRAVDSTARSMMLVCAFVLVFSGVSAVINELGVISWLSHRLALIMTEQEAAALLFGIMEVTTGCNALFPAPSFLIFVIITGFSGICVQLQIKAIMEKIRMRYFYLFRPLYVLLSCFFSMILIRLFGGTASVFGHQDAIIPKPFVVSPFFSVLLLILSLFLLLSVKKSDTIKDKDGVSSQKG